MGRIRSCACSSYFCCYAARPDGSMCAWVGRVRWDMRTSRVSRAVVDGTRVRRLLRVWLPHASTLQRSEVPRVDCTYPFPRPRDADTWTKLNPKTHHRNIAQVSGGERELRTMYLKPFNYACMDALSIMTAYASYDGIPNVANRREFFLSPCASRDETLIVAVAVALGSGYRYPYRYRTSLPPTAGITSCNTDIPIPAPQRMELPILCHLRRRLCRPPHHPPRRLPDPRMRGETRA